MRMGNRVDSGEYMLQHLGIKNFELKKINKYKQGAVKEHLNSHRAGKNECQDLLNQPLQHWK